jgi:hypothetical protein
MPHIHSVEIRPSSTGQYCWASQTLFISRQPSQGHKAVFKYMLGFPFDMNSLTCNSPKLCAYRLSDQPTNKDVILESYSRIASFTISQYLFERFQLRRLLNSCVILPRAIRRDLSGLHGNSASTQRPLDFPVKHRHVDPTGRLSPFRVVWP